jgi:predicted RNase H-like HicB family nuclease
MQLRIAYEEAEEGGYVARVVGVPGAISEGETREEAREAVLDALRELVLSYIDVPDPVAEGEETVNVQVG